MLTDHWLGLSWVMSTPITTIIALLGIACLMLTMAANRYKREGLRLWLYRCHWGMGADPKWLGTEGHADQMKVLLETLQKPTVLGKSVAFGGRDTQWYGFWLQIQVPGVLAGQALALEPMMANDKRFYSLWLETQISSFYEQFLNGNWVDPTLLGKLPNVPPHETRQSDFPYTGTEQHRLWQVWFSISCQLGQAIHPPVTPTFPHTKKEAAPMFHGAAFSSLS